MRWFGWMWVCFGVIGCQREESGREIRTQAIISAPMDLRHPGVGVLVRAGVPFCTGTLVAPRVVLTAGHCVDIGRAGDVGGAAVAFRIDLPDPASPRGFRSVAYPTIPEGWDTHPDWATPSQVNDIGIAVLKEAVPGSVATPIPWNDRDLETIALPATALFLGYGLIVSVPHPLSPDAKHGADLRIRLQGSLVISGDSRQSICHGDSGGPVLMAVDGQLRVVAVNAFGLNSSLVPGSNPPRLTCQGEGASYRTDRVTPYLRDRMIRAGEEGGSCSTDPICGACGYCDQGQCRRRTLGGFGAACLPCQSDPDCGSSGICYPFPEGKACLRSCDPSGCCNDGAVCVSFRRGVAIMAACLPQAGVCSRSCLDDQGCQTGEICKGGRCAKASLPAAGRLCQPCEEETTCDPGGLCLGKREGIGVCGISCEVEGRCPEGFACQRLASGIAAQCLPKSREDGRVGACVIRCQDQASCPSGWACRGGICQRGQGQEEGEACGPILCRAGLLCTPTVEGLRCLQPCRRLPGTIGGACGASGGCVAGSLCLPLRGLKRRFCFAQCQTSADCPYGGVCSGGSCFCSHDVECKADSFCEVGLGSSSGFCVPKAEAIGCPAGAVCRHDLEGSVCVSAKTEGARLQGQSCDEMTGCRPPLNCVQMARQIGLCTRFCRQDRDCQGQGICVDGQCFCQSDLDCSAGQRCHRIRPSSGIGLIGVCLFTGDPGLCLAQTDCLPGMLCHQGRCLSPERDKEGSEEGPSEGEESKASEGSDGGEGGPSEGTGSDAWEGRPRPEGGSEGTENPNDPAREVRPDVGGQELAKLQEARPSVAGGCGCSVDQTPALGWLFLLAFGALVRRKGGMCLSSHARILQTALDACKPFEMKEKKGGVQGIGEKKGEV